MRLLYILPYVPSLIRVRPYHFIRELAQQNEVTVLACAREIELASAKSLRGLNVNVEVAPFRMSEALRRCGEAFVRGKPLQSAVCRSQELETRLVRIIDSQRPDVVHVEHFRAAHLGAVIPPEQSTLFDSVDCISLLQERTLHSSHSLRQRVLARIELSRTRRYEATVLKSFDRTVVASSDDQDALQRLSPATPISVVPNGVDLDYFQPPRQTRPKDTIIFSGKMSYHANVTAVLHFVSQILPRIRKSHPHASLVIAGSDPPRAIRALTVDPSITVTGYLPDLRVALDAATVAICPVRVKVGIQNKVLEAMAVGLPVVCSREGAMGLAAQPGRDFLVGDDASSFADHVCRLLDDASLRDQIGQSGRAFVETHHHWSSAVRHLESLYADVIESHRTRYPSNC